MICALIVANWIFMFIMDTCSRFSIAICTYYYCCVIIIIILHCGRDPPKDQSPYVLDSAWRKREALLPCELPLLILQSPKHFTYEVASKCTVLDIMDGKYISPELPLSYCSPISSEGIAMATSLQIHGYIWFCVIWLVYILFWLLYWWLFNDLDILSNVFLYNETLSL